MNVDINRYLIGISTEMSNYKKIIINNRTGICIALRNEINNVINKQPDRDTLMKLYFSPINDDIIKNAVNKTQITRVMKLNIHKNKTDLYPFILYLCTGKNDNVLFQNFKVLTDIDFKKKQVEDLYSNLNKNRLGMDRIDNSIFKGINRLQENDIQLYNPDVTEQENTLYGYVKNQSKESKITKHKYVIAINTIDYMLKNKEIIFTDIKSTYTDISEGKYGNKLKVNSQNLYDFIKEYKQVFSILFDQNHDISNGFNNESFSILFSSTIKGNFKVKDLIDKTIKRADGSTIRGSYKYSIIRDSTKMMTLKRNRMRALVLPKINVISAYENYNESSLEDSYIGYLKHNGFRK